MNSIEYPYLANTPIPISIEYETIKFELNFQSYNIKGGDGSIPVKYYQILYKVSCLSKILGHFLDYSS